MLQLSVLPVTALAQNCSLLWDDQTMEAVFTDVGGDVDYLLNELEQRNLKLKALWLTHGHFDHVGGVEELLSKKAVEVYGPHQDDLFLLENLEQIAAQYGMKAKNFYPTKFLNENDELKLGKYIFQVLHIPGHTPGSIVYYCQEANLLIAGDVLFRQSIGRADFPRSDANALIKGIKEKLFFLPDNTRVITGHGPLTSIEYEKKHNPFV